MTEKLAVVIVDYKSMNTTCEYIKKFCDRVKDYEGCVFAIVDNSDEDNNYKTVWNEFEYAGKCEAYKTDYSNAAEVHRFLYKGCTIFALKADGNIGYARGNNLGVDYIVKAQKLDVAYLLISNNDILFLEDIKINDLLEPFKNDDSIAVIGPKILEKKEGVQQSPRNKLPIWKLLILYNVNLMFCNRLKKYVDDVERNPSSGKYYWVTGCFLLIDTNKFYKAGMFDNDTFLYSEEMILSERLKRQGYTIYYCDKIRVFHNHGKTINKHVSSNINVKYLYQSHRLCCERYRNASRAVLAVADFVFEIYKRQYFVKQKIKALFGGGR